MTPHLGLIITPFQEWRGTYEYEKTQALAKHLRTMLDVLTRASVVSVCPDAPERPYLMLQEWEGPHGREGQWGSDLHVEYLR